MSSPEATVETRYGFTLLTSREFETWIAQYQVARTVLTVQQHHTWSPTYRNFTGANHFDLQQGMKRYHVTNNGWNDIGQHFTTFPDGTIMTGRSLEQTPACIKGQNANALCIEHLGNFDTGGDVMTEAHRATIVNMTAAICRRFAVPLTVDRVVYHHWFDLDTGARTNGRGNTKSCPGTAFFGGNTVDHAERLFLPLVRQALGGTPADTPRPPSTGMRYGAVTADTLNVRGGPSSDAARINTARLGAILRVYEDRTGWLRIAASRQEWVSARFVHFVERATVNADTLNVRSGPGANFDRLTALFRNQEVYIHETRDGWCRIGLESRWVSEGYPTR